MPALEPSGVFGTTVETTPWPGAYLGADPELALEKRRQTPCARPDEAHSLRVGVAWAGNPRYKADRLRSVKLATLLPLLRTECIHWIALQKGVAAEQLATYPETLSFGRSQLRPRPGRDRRADLHARPGDYHRHLHRPPGRAMAKPVWILLPHLSDWRWMQQTDATPWYPTAWLLRQSAPGDWPCRGARDWELGDLQAARIR